MSDDRINNEEEKGSARIHAARGSKFMRERLQGKAFLVPNFITVIALFCGFLGLINAIKGNFEYATKCIALSIILDGLDGRVARKLHATSEFGRELDSLSDLIAFGAAPAVLVYQWAFARSVDDIGLLACFVFVVCSATRLARFNITTTIEVKKHFTGLPTPGAAAALASIVYLYPQPIENVYVIGALLAYTILIAVLMVSTLPFLSVKHLKLQNANPRLTILAAALIVALTWYHRLVIIVGSTAYALSGIWLYAWSRRSPQTLEEKKRRWL